MDCYDAMNIGIMQPYFFPYLGYYQLAANVDHFIFLDDVKMIQRGYINRNHILLHGAPYRFTLPIKKSSQNRDIHQHYFLENHEDFLKTIYNAYWQAPYFKEINTLIQNILKKSTNVAECCASSIHEVFSYLQTPLSHSFSSSYPSELKAQDRIIDLCKKFKAQAYYNPIGGKTLYEAEKFKKNGIHLYFFHGQYPAYQHNKKYGTPVFLPQLSMIDILMNVSKDDALSMLKMKNIEAA